MGNEQSDLLPPVRPEELIPENWPEDTLMQACMFPQMGGWDFILFLLAVVPHQANYVDEIDNCTPLLMVCRFADVPATVVRELIDLSLPSVFQRKGGLLETTPLSMACERGASDEVIRMLLEADPETARIKDRRERTPIEIAQFYGHPRIVLVLLTWAIYKVKQQQQQRQRLCCQILGMQPTE